jgi:hypothetical protein
MEEDSWFMGNASLFRRKALADIGGFPEALHAFTDGYVSRLLALKHGACFTPEVLCAWRRLAGGVASAQTLNIAKTMQVIGLVEQKMAEAGDTFPPGYAELWKGRHLFASRRFALVQERQRAQSEGMLAYLSAMAHELVMTPWLFLKLRPRDLVTVVRRRVRVLMQNAGLAS